VKRACRSLIAASALTGLLCAAPVLACGTPTEEWYVDVSDVVFDASADCTEEQRSCRLRVHRVVKNPDHLALERRTIEVDFQNWYADWYEANPDRIILACGVPLFEPEQDRFRARFYANLDEDSSELIVRRARISGGNASTEE